MASARWGFPWEELLLDRAWPAYLFILILYAKLTKLIGTFSAPHEGAAAGPELAADVAHQVGTILVVGVVVILFILRRPPVGARSSLVGALVAVIGTVGLSFFALAPTDPSADWRVLAVSAALAGVGSVFTVFSLAALGRCFGIFPEARGLVTHGPYQFVRHPVYLGEFISGFGLLLPILTPLTALVFIGFVAFQVWRIFNEERVLEATFPDYAQYRTRTWRLVPGVF